MLGPDLAGVGVAVGLASTEHLRDEPTERGSEGLGFLARLTCGDLRQKRSYGASMSMADVPVSIQ